MGTGDDLKNRSTTVAAESAGLQLRPVRTGPTTDGAGSKWSAEKWVTTTGSPPYGKKYILQLHIAARRDPIHTYTRLK